MQIIKVLGSPTKGYRYRDLQTASFHYKKTSTFHVCSKNVSGFYMFVSIFCEKFGFSMKRFFKISESWVKCNQKLEFVSKVPSYLTLLIVRYFPVTPWNVFFKMQTVIVIKYFNFIKYQQPTPASHGYLLWFKIIYFIDQIKYEKLFTEKTYQNFVKIHQFLYLK